MCVGVPGWKPGAGIDSYGSSPRRSGDGTGSGVWEAVEMLRGGPGSVLKELMVRFANGVREWSWQQLQGFDLRNWENELSL